MSLVKGTTANINYTIMPSNASDKSVSWFSSDENVITVSDEGEISTINNGHAIITAITAEGGYLSRSEIQVVEKTGLKSNLRNDSFSVYPNPFTTSPNIYFYKDISVNITILDINEKL